MLQKYLLKKFAEIENYCNYKYGLINTILTYKDLRIFIQQRARL